MAVPRPSHKSVNPLASAVRIFSDKLDLCDFEKRITQSFTSRGTGETGTSSSQLCSSVLQISSDSCSGIFPGQVNMVASLLERVIMNFKTCNLENPYDSRSFSDNCLSLIAKEQKLFVIASLLPKTRI